MSQSRATAPGHTLILTADIPDGAVANFTVTPEYVQAAAHSTNATAADITEQPAALKSYVATAEAVCPR